MIRGTHGLPCAHEIVELIREVRPIPPSIIHPHWMKLDLIKGKVNEVSFNLNIKAKLESIITCFVAYDEFNKLALKRKLREFGDPSTIFLIPSLEKAKKKGRPTSKVDKLIQRDSSYFEIAEYAYDSTSSITPTIRNSIKVRKR